MEPDIVSVTADLHVNKHSATALRAEPVEALLLPLAAEGRGDKALPAVPANKRFLVLTSA